MKRFFLLLSFIVFSVAALLAQTPQKMTYQAVVRNAGNSLVTNQNVSARISILQGSETGAPVYVETHNVTTNANGLMTLEVGSGSPTTGTFANINWANGPFFLKSEIDPDGGISYSITGVQQLMSVPYALYAAKAGNVPAFVVVPTDTGYVVTITQDGATPQTFILRNGTPGPQGPQGPQGAPGVGIPQTISLNGNVLTLSDGGGTVTIPIPTVPTNVSAFNNDAGYLTSFTEQQILTISNDTIYLTGGSFVKLPAGFDGDYNHLTNKPNLFDGNYNSLTNKPNLAPVATSGAYNDLTGKPNLAPVATSGNYNDLTNKPQIPTVPTNVSAFTNDAGYLTSFTEQQVLTISNDTIYLTGGSFVKLPAGFDGDYNHLTNKPNLFDGNYNSLTNKPNLAPVATSGNYNDLSNKPQIPTVPTNVSAFQNDAGYLTSFTEQQVLSISNDTIYLTGGSFVKLPAGFDGDYNHLTNKPQIPTVPTNVSAFQNDAGYITQTAVPTNVSQLQNDAGYLTSFSEQQVLSISNDTIYLTGGSFVKLPATDGLDNLANQINTLQQQIDEINFECGTSTVKDYDGNEYNTVKIGNQCWTKENIRSTHYSDGTSIDLGSDSSTTTAYRYNPGGNANNVPTQGYLYNWKAVMQNSSSSNLNPSGVQGICPTGWHVPSSAEWTQLFRYMNNQSQYLCNGSIAKALAATSGWVSSNGSCAVGNNQENNNASGFSAVSVGNFHGFGFYSSGYSAGFWESTQHDDVDAYSVFLDYASSNMSSLNLKKYQGLSVRCLRDNSASASLLENLAPVAYSGDYNDLTNKPNLFDGNYNSLTNKPQIPTVPTNVSAFQNDAGYITQTAVPTNVSAFQNDAGYITQAAVPTNVSQLQNDAGYLTSFSESQILTISNDTIYLTGGSFVKLPAGFDGDYNSLTNKPNLFNGDYNNLTNKPNLFSGDYNDLTNRPQIPQIPQNVSAFQNDAGYLTSFSEQQVLSISNDTIYLTGGSFVKLPAGFDGDYNHLTNKPNLFSGDYNDLTNKPSFTESQILTISNDTIYLTGGSFVKLPTAEGFSGSYNDLTDKPQIPTVPTNVSAFQNDAGYLTSFTESQILTISNDTIYLTGGSFVKLPAGFDGDYNSLTNKPNLFNGDYNNLTNKPNLFSGDYNDLTNRPQIPTVPTNVSAFQNDAGYLTSFTESQILTISNDTIYLTGGSFVKLPTAEGFSGSYNDLTDKPQIPTVPTNVSAFQNDAGYLTSFSESQILTISNDTIYLTGGSFVKLPTAEGFSGSYNDLTDKPNLFSGNYNDLTGKPNLFSGDYNDLSNRPQIPQIPQNVSAFQNDAGYLTSFTESQILTISNDTIYLTGGSFVKLPAGFDGDYNHLINKPNLFDGNYNSLTNKPNLFSGNYNDLTGKPNLFSGDYNDLTNKPTFTESQILTISNDTIYLTGGSFVKLPAGFDGDYNHLINKPNLFDGNYNSLTNKPNLFSGNYNDLTGKPNLFSGDYNDLTNRPQIPQIPQNVSAFQNDAGYLTSFTESQILTISNDTIFLTGGSFVKLPATNGLDSLANQVATIQQQLNGMNFECGTSTVKDYDGNEYNTVKIGTQCWIKENLRTTHYSDGTSIDLGSDSSTTTAYRYNPGGNANNVPTQGYLYNWKAVMRNSSSSNMNPSGVQGICPTGWHVPSGSEWTQLDEYVNSQSIYRCEGNSYHIAKALAATSGWNSDNGTCTIGNHPENNNATGFSVLSVGSFHGFGYFNSGYDATFWEATENNEISEGNGESTTAYCRIFAWNREGILGWDSKKFHGYSVRCLRDNNTSADADEPSSLAPVAYSGDYNDLTNKPTFTEQQVLTISNDTIFLTGGSFVKLPAISSSDSLANQIAALQQQIDEVNFVCGQSKMRDIDGNVYNTVKIGNQCWAKENLRTTHYADGSSIDLGSDTSSTTAYRYNPGNNTNNVATYGYLYNWSAVMHGARSSDANPSGVQGICPTGWHVPSDKEWEELENYVSSQSQYVCGNASTKIAKALAATSGWSSSNTDCAIGNGLENNNATGFSALPAGFYSSNNYAINFGSYTYIWSTYKSSNRSAHGWTLGTSYTSLEWFSHEIFIGLSVRCLHDSIISPISEQLNSVQEQNAALHQQVADLQQQLDEMTFVCGQSKMHDIDGNAYNTVKIGNQCWMKENLRTTHFSDGTSIPESHDTSSTIAYRYNNTSSSIPLAQRGYHYNWSAVMHGAASSNANPSGVQGICPTGWHVPSEAEWNQLTNYVSSQSRYVCGSTDYGYLYAKALADSTGWDASSTECAIGNNLSTNNATGFSALPVSFRYIDDQYFHVANGEEAYFWSSNKKYFSLSYRYGYVFNLYNGEYYHAFSVRCLRDTLTTTINEQVNSAQNQLEGMNFFVCGTSTVKDYDDNEYNTVKIGNQCWMKDNLRTTHYSDGTSIGLGSDTSSTTAYRYRPGNSSYNVATYGYLYNWAAVMHGAASSNANPSGVQGICPTGWHVPSREEWIQLTDYVSGQSQYVCGSDNNNIAKSLATTTGWANSNVSCAVGNSQEDNNATGLSLLPAGSYQGSYSYFGDRANYWTSLQGDPSNLVIMYTLKFSDANVYRYAANKYDGYSVRCLRDVTSVGEQLQNVSEQLASLASLPIVVTEPAHSVNGGYSNIVTGGTAMRMPSAPAITARGVCWSTSHNPTVNGNHTTNGSGTGSFSAHISGLSAGTTYYIRAYATNSAGTTYGEEVSLTTINCGTTTVTDINDNTYNTVKIGNQCWLKQNLRATSYADGTPITDASNTLARSASTPYFYANFSGINSLDEYYDRGLLYNWAAVMHGESSSMSNPSGVQGPCPNSWHVPSDAEWTQLIDYVSSQSQYLCGSSGTLICKALAYTSGWTEYTTYTCAVGYNQSSNNATGFSAVPAGYFSGSSFGGVGLYAYFWTSTASGGLVRTVYIHNTATTTPSRYSTYGDNAYAVRCIHD